MCVDQGLSKKEQWTGNVRLMAAIGTEDDTDS